jgi:hypothetical protein
MMMHGQTQIKFGKILGPLTHSLWQLRTVVLQVVAAGSCRTSEPAFSCQLDVYASHKVASFPFAVSYLRCYIPGQTLSPKRPDRFSDPPSLPTNRYRGEEGYFLLSKVLWRESDHSYPCGAKGKECMVLFLHSPYVIMWCGT